MDNKRIFVSGGACLYLCGMLLLLPLPWIGAVVLAAVVHELGHYAIIRLFCEKPSLVRIYTYAAQIQLPEMDRWKELLCAIAGPVAGLSLLLTARWLPRTAVCALGQSIFNLVPICPLDGGRALQCVLSFFLPPPKVALWCNIVALCFKCVGAGLAIWCSFRYDLGILPLLAIIWIVFRKIKP